MRPAGDEPLDCTAVRRIGDQDRDRLSRDQPGNDIGARRIAVTDTVTAELPDVAGSGRIGGRRISDTDLVIAGPSVLRHARVVGGGFCCCGCCGQSALPCRDDAVGALAALAGLADDTAALLAQAREERPQAVWLPVGRRDQLGRGRPLGAEQQLDDRVGLGRGLGCGLDRRRRWCDCGVARCGRGRRIGGLGTAGVRRLDPCGSCCGRGVVGRHGRSPWERAHQRATPPTSRSPGDRRVRGRSSPAMLPATHDLTNAPFGSTVQSEATSDTSFIEQLAMMAGRRDWSALPSLIMTLVLQLVEHQP